MWNSSVFLCSSCCSAVGQSDELAGSPDRRSELVTAIAELAMLRSPINQEAARALSPALTERLDPQRLCLTSTDAVDRCFCAAYYREAGWVARKIPCPADAGKTVGLVAQQTTVGTAGQCSWRGPLSNGAG